jgi:N-hydroxyarylamine O-acetyltransferase
MQKRGLAGAGQAAIETATEQEHGMNFCLAGYLDRIGQPAAAPSQAALAALQAAQLCAIPFENLDPFLGRVPQLAPSAVFDKPVTSRRGGYCHELNLLFGQALAALGCALRPVLGRVRMGAPTGGPRTHLAQVVRIDGRDWLADTGFGGPGPEVPLALDSDDEIETRLGRYRLRGEGVERVLERHMPEGWFALYGIDSVPVTLPDIEAANVVCALWDRSPFPAHLMLNRVTGVGRSSLLDLRLTEARSCTVGSADALAAVLRDVFDLPDDPAMASAAWRKLAPAGLRRTG